METSAAASGFIDEVQTAKLETPELDQLVDSAAAVKQHLEKWELAIEGKLVATEQMLDQQLMQIQNVISQFNRTLETATNQDWQRATTAVHIESKQQTILMQETCNELKKSTKDICSRVERTTQQITKSLNNTMQGLRVGELQQLVEDSASDVKNFAETTANQVSNIVKWFHWKNLGLVFLLSLIVTLLVSLYIDDEWPWEAHNAVVKQRLAGQAVLSAWSQLTQLDRQQIMDDVA